MALPISYNIRNVFVRWRSTLATILGVGLVVAVYVLIQSLAAGLERSSANTGDPRNVLITRKGSTAESSSQVTRDQVKVIQFLPGVARNDAGEPLLSADVLVLISVPRVGGQGEANVNVRGMSPIGRELRPQVTLVAGRWFSSGKREVVVAQRLAARFANFNIGQTFKTAGQELTVVGWMDGGNTAFDSEVWMDVDQARAVFDRDYFSSVVVRSTDPGNTNLLTGRLEGDKRLPLRAERETDYYSNQTMTATPIRFLGNFLASAMSIGAVFAAMNTMYASVGARTREIGTLRVLGYRRRWILVGFLLEGGLLALVGGMVGCLLALPMNGYATGTLSFNTFSEVVFQFRITPQLAVKGLAFAFTVGVIGSFLPALRASRLPVIASLKSL
ncbi:MAG TPA: ABC transporter permease [Methylomirabilota bacterium]|nr:ABC transporter permease [Methylomirabilota bacterium]